MKLKNQLIKLSSFLELYIIFIATTIAYFESLHYCYSHQQRLCALQLLYISYKFVTFSVQLAIIIEIVCRHIIIDGNYPSIEMARYFFWRNKTISIFVIIIKSIFHLNRN